MLELPGIDPDKVQRYGKRFLKIIRASQGVYESLMRQQEDRPQDPNHQNVIDISSDGDSADDDGFGDFELEDGSQEERSTYFKAPADVNAFNAQCKSWSDHTKFCIWTFHS